MVKISESQMQSLFRARLLPFLRDTVDVLRAHAPAFIEGLDDMEALEKVTSCVDKAFSYRLKSQRDVRRFIAIQTVLGPDFDGDGQFDGVVAALNHDFAPAMVRLTWAEEMVEAQFGQGD